MQLKSFALRNWQPYQLLVIFACLARLLVCEQMKSEDVHVEADYEDNVVESEENLEEAQETLTETEFATESNETRKIFDEAMSMLSGSRSRLVRRAAIRKLVQAAEEGSGEAMGQLGYISLFGEDELHGEAAGKPSAWSLRQNVTRAYELFELAAQRGVASAQLGLGFMHSVGLAPQGVSQSRALVYLTFAALGGHEEAQTALAYRHWTGCHVEQSCETALNLYLLAASRVAERITLLGPPQRPAAQRVRLDELESSAAISDELLEYHVLLADGGDQTAQVALGQLFYFGARGLPQDFRKAEHYFSKAAVQGNALACAHLAKMHLDGTAKPDNATAYILFRKAAEQGHPFGHAGVGLMHLLGLGVVQDFAKAYTHLTVAVEHGWVDGQHQLALMHYRGLGVRRDLRRAAQLFGAAAHGGNVLALYNLAQLHVHGLGTVRSCPAAVELLKNVAERSADQLFELAVLAYRPDAANNDAALVRFLFLAELGHELAQSNAAYILERGETLLFRPFKTSKNATKHSLLRLASVYWHKAALQGSGLARLKLGDYYYYGLGVAKDYELASAYYRVAAEQHKIAQALFNLGLMHHFGHGVQTDLHLAKRYYDQAAETSAEAVLPVALALAHLHVRLLVDWLRHLTYFLLTAYFDLVLLFLLLFAFVLFAVRR